MPSNRGFTIGLRATKSFLILWKILTYKKINIGIDYIRKHAPQKLHTSSFKNKFFLESKNKSSKYIDEFRRVDLPVGLEEISFNLFY